MTEPYNTYESIPLISYNVISYLIENNETIFKLLYYNDSNAWRSDVNHPDLTKVQKGVLVFDGIKPQTDCRIFMDTGNDDSWQVESTQLRVSVVKGVPTNHVFGYITKNMISRNSLNNRNSQLSRFNLPGIIITCVHENSTICLWFYSIKY